MHMARALLLTLLTVSVAAAAEEVSLKKLSSALDEVRTYQAGDDGQPLEKVETLVVRALNGSGRAAVEKRLIAALKEAKTADAKAFLCRQLRTLGTDRSVPALAELLDDPKTAHMARYALGRIDTDAAAAALLEAVGRTSGEIRAGLLNTLANRGHRPALDAFVRHLTGSPPTVATAAARGLGKLGGDEAVKALRSARPDVSEPVRAAVDRALLRCAERYVRKGRPDAAVAIYERFHQSDRPMHLRVAGLRGLAKARPEQGVPLVAEAIRSDHGALRRAAAGLIRDLEAPQAAKRFADMLPSLPASIRPQVIRAIGALEAPEAAPALAKQLDSDHAPVRKAALRALGRIGDASVVGPLASAAAAASGKEQRIARASLVRMEGEGVDAALRKRLETDNPAQKVEIIKALAGRGVTRATETLVPLARADHDRVRRAALAALGELAGEENLPTLVALLVDPAKKADRGLIRKAIGEVFQRIDPVGKRADPVLAALSDASPAAKAALLRLLDDAPTKAALKTLRDALDASDEAVRKAAVRTLSQWPTPAPAEDLLRLARGGETRARKVLALRGYVRLAERSEEPQPMYRKALALAEEPQQKKLVFAGLGKAGSVAALDLLEPYLDKPALRSAAATALVQIAGRVGGEARDRAVKAVKKVVSAADRDAIRKKARKVLNDLTRYEDHILTWEAAGPYQGEGKRSKAIFKRAFAPEKDPASVDWRPIEKGVGDWNVNLQATFGSKDHVAAYVRTRIRSPKQQEARLEIGSDDAVKAWLNGDLVHENYTNRGVGPRQDIVDVELDKGWNTLMLKAVEPEGGWAFACRVRDRNGAALEGLEYRLEP